MKKNKFFEKAVTIVTALVVMLVLILSSCSKDEAYIMGGKKPSGGNDSIPEPVNPEWYVNKVLKLDCQATMIKWKSTLGIELTTKSLGSETVQYDENAQANVSHKYTADIEYRDKNNPENEKHSQPSLSYESNLTAYVGGINKPMVFKSEEEMLRAIEDATLSLDHVANVGDKYFELSFGGARVLSITTAASLSKESLSFEGVKKTDLCSSEFDNPELINIDRQKVTTDQKGYSKYQLPIKVKLTVLNAGKDDNVRYMNFLVKNAYIIDSSNPDPIEPVDPEIIGYDVINPNFSNGYTSGTIVAIYDDLTQKEIGSFKEKLEHSTLTPEDLSLTVNNLDWTTGETSKVELASTGENREVSLAAGCKLVINKVYTAVTNRSDKAAMTFRANYDIPRVQFPDGKSKEVAYGKYTLTDRGVSENTALTTKTSKTLVHKADASFEGSSSESLSANVVLNKSGDNPTPGENIETMILIENFTPKDNVYIFDIVHYWSNQDPTRENVSQKHFGEITAEAEKLTNSRNYNTTTPKMNPKGTQDCSQTTNEGSRIEGTITTYESKFIFAGVNVITQSKIVNYIKVTSKSGNTAEININSAAYKTGQSLGTQDFGDASKHVYKDNVNFALPVQGADIASCTQILRFEEKIDTPIDPEPEDPITDIFASIKSNTIDFINGYWTATMKATIKNSKGIERDTTMQRVYLEAGVSYDAIADFESSDNNFNLPNVSNDGSASTYSKGDITYTKQTKKAVADKFNQKITVINGSSSVTVAGQKLDFLSTEIDVNPTGKNQVQSPTAQGKYNVWASEVSYRHGFGSHFDNSTTNFNIKVEKPKEYIDLSFKPIAAAVSLAFNDDHSQSGAYIVCTILGEGGKARLYTSPYNKNGNMTIGTNYKDFSDVRSCPHIPSATHDNQGNLIPASLEVVDKDWVYTPIHSEGTPNMVSSAENLIDGRKSPLISKGSVENGILTITINGQEYYFRGTN